MIARWLWPTIWRDGEAFTLRRWWRSNYRGTLLLQSRVGRGLNALLWRIPLWKALTARVVWSEIDRDDEFRLGIEEGMRDSAAGRWYELVGDDLVPSGTWRADDPIQPDDWMHDGTRWVKKP